MKVNWLLTIVFMPLTLTARGELTAAELADACTKTHALVNSPELAAQVGMCLGYIAGYLNAVGGSFVNLAPKGKPRKLYEVSFGEGPLKPPDVADQLVTYVRNHAAHKQESAISQLDLMLLANGGETWTPIE